MQIERAAEITGTVTFDDGSPAIGMHFQLFRKSAKGDLTAVGLSLLDSWTLHAVSDGHGRYNLTNLQPGEYAVCTLMPAESEDAAPRVCLGNTFRKRDAKSVKVEAGETANGADIEIPLSGLHSVAGLVTALSDGHTMAHGNIRLIYADDRAPGARNRDPGRWDFCLRICPARQVHPAGLQRWRRSAERHPDRLPTARMPQQRRLRKSTMQTRKSR